MEEWSVWEYQVLLVRYIRGQQLNAMKYLGLRSSLNWFPTTAGLPACGCRVSALRSSTSQTIGKAMEANVH